MFMNYFRSCVFLLFGSVFVLPAIMTGADAREIAGRQKPAYFQAVTAADGAQFIVRLNNPGLIQKARDIVSGKERKAVHLSALIVKASATYNPGWSFHLDPDSVGFFAVAAEACDAATVLVEQRLNDAGGQFLPGGRWCPWSSFVVGELSAPHGGPVVTVSSAASLSEVAVSPSSLATLQGENLTKTVESAADGEPPTKLAGVQVEFRRTGSSQGTKAKLLMASPGRINFNVPAEVAPGTYTVNLIRDNDRDLQTATRVESVAPGIFFVEAGSSRYAAATLLRVRSDGTRSDEPLVTADGSGNVAAVPVDFGNSGDRLYLSVYGTGIGSSKVTVGVGSESNVPVLYSGPQGSMQGLDQVNLELPLSLASRSDADLTVSAKNKDGKTLQSPPVKLLFRRSP
jgi:uncharacterized protein (TIGR03437 family)